MEVVVARSMAMAMVAALLFGSTTPAVSGGSAGGGGGCNCRRVWVALEDDHEIALVDIDSKRVLKRRSVAGRPHNLTISPNGNTVATALWNAARIAIFRDGKIDHVYLAGAPHDLKIDGGRIVVANQSDARVDLVTPEGKFLSSISLKADPHDLALRRNGDQAWVTLEGSDDMAVVNVDDKSVRYVSTGKDPHDLLFAPDGKLWVSDWEGAIHVFSRRGRLIKTIPLGVEAHHMDFTPNGRQIWITDHAVHAVFVLNTDTYKIRKRFSIKGAPHHVAITPDGRRAIVADHDRALLVVYNVRKLQRVGTIKVGNGPHGVWAVP